MTMKTEQKQNSGQCNDPRCEEIHKVEETRQPKCLCVCGCGRDATFEPYTNQTCWSCSYGSEGHSTKPHVRIFSYRKHFGHPTVEISRSEYERLTAALPTQPIRSYNLRRSDGQGYVEIREEDFNSINRPDVGETG